MTALWRINLWVTLFFTLVAALGMLLLLRDHAGGDHAQIRLLNCNSDVRKILAISNFEQLFQIV